MPIRNSPQRARRDWVNDVVDFANLTGASAIRDSDLHRHSLSYQENLAFGKLKSLEDFDNVDWSNLSDAEFKTNKAALFRSRKKLEWSMSPNGSSYGFAPNQIRINDADESQRRLRKLLDALAEAEWLTREIEQEMEATIHDLRLAGSVTKPIITITSLDQWWGFPIHSWRHELVGRVRTCGWRKCSNYFVGWNKGQMKHFCSPAHQNAEAQQRRRDLKKCEEAAKKAKAAYMRKKRNRPGLGGAI